MRVTSVELHPSGSSEIATLSFRDPTGSNPYNIKTITGLDATDGIAPKFYGNSGSSGVAFYNLAMSKRTIALNIALNPRFALNKSYSDLRDDLYKMISSSRTGQIQLQFLNEIGVVAAISGFVAKFEALLFDKAPSVVLTLDAVDPMLTALSLVEVPVIGLNPVGFLVADDLSTAPHGFNLVARISGNIPSLAISDPYDGTWSFEIFPSTGFLNGDMLHISSDPKTKQLYLVRGGVTLYLAEAIVPGSVWPVLFPGDNHFSFTNPTHVALEEISHYPTYWGV